MNSRLDSIWYAIQHPLGPSRELGSYENHQKSVDKLIGEMKKRVQTDSAGMKLACGTTDFAVR